MYKTQYGAKPLSIIFEKVHGYNRKCDSSKYLVSSHSEEKYVRIFDKMRYLIMLKKQYFRPLFP